MITEMSMLPELIEKNVKAYIIFIEEGKLLLVQEAIGGIRGLWGFPGGGVEKREDPEQAVKREALEEVGYVAGSIKKVGVYIEPDKNSTRHVFKGRVVGGALKLHPDELMDAKWFTLGEIDDLNMRGEWVKEVIKDVFDK